MSQPEGELCENCVYWEAGEGPRSETMGSCLRRAPMPVLLSADTPPTPERTTFAAWWPVTNPDDWCGEWKEQP